MLGQEEIFFHQKHSLNIETDQTESDDETCEQRGKSLSAHESDSDHTKSLKFFGRLMSKAAGYLTQPSSKTKSDGELERKDAEPVNLITPRGSGNESSASERSSDGRASCSGTESPLFRRVSSEI